MPEPQPALSEPACATLRRMALFEKTFSDDRGAGFDLRVTEEGLSTTRFFGRGSLEITHAFIDALDEGIDVVPDELIVRGRVDMSELEGTPLRAQFLVGKWLLKNKQRFAKIAVFGARPWEAKVARAVMKIARMRNVGFFDTDREADDYLAL